MEHYSYYKYYNSPFFPLSDMIRACMCARDTVCFVPRLCLSGTAVPSRHRSYVGPNILITIYISMCYS